MGCCATKAPTVFKGDEAQEPVPLASTSWNKETVDEATESQNNGEADLNHDNFNVKGKDVLHQTNKRRSLSYLFKQEEMQMLAKTNNTQESMELRKKTMQRQSSKANHDKRPELAYIAPENHESLQSIETKSIPEDKVIMNHEIEDPTKAIERNHKPDLVYLAPGNVDSVPPIKAKSTPEELMEVNVITNQQIEEPEPLIELIDEPEDMLVDLEKIEEIQSTEDKLAPKVKEMEEPAKPIKQVDESDTPKASADTGKLEKANVSTNQKIEGPEDLVGHTGDPIDGFPGNIDHKSEN